MRVEEMKLKRKPRLDTGSLVGLVNEVILVLPRQSLEGESLGLGQEEGSSESSDHL